MPPALESQPPGNAQGIAQGVDAQAHLQASQHPDTNTQEMQSALKAKETQLAAAQKKAEQLSAQLAEANRLAEDTQCLLQAKEQTSSTVTKQSAQLEQQLKAKPASLDALQKQLDTNSKPEAAKMHKLQGTSTPNMHAAFLHSGLGSDVVHRTTCCTLAACIASTSG